MPPNMNLILFVFIVLVTSSNISLQSNEKSLKIDSMTQTNHSSPKTANGSESFNFKNNTEGKARDEHFEEKIFFQPYDADIPESFKMGFYLFIGLSIAGIVFILLKINRMRLSRAERKYGVHGDRTTQELTPLPMAIEEDSDNEDHTVFDINRQIRKKNCHLVSNGRFQNHRNAFGRFWTTKQIYFLGTPNHTMNQRIEDYDNSLS